MRRLWLLLGVGVVVIVVLAAVLVLIPAPPPKHTQSSGVELVTSTAAPVAGGGEYVVYDQSLLSRANQGRVVLFFHAPWCPTCRGLERDIQANLDRIPTDVTILKTDYDTNIELRRKYGVTYQHALVQVNPNGEMITKFSGSPTLVDLIAGLQ